MITAEDLKEFESGDEVIIRYTDGRGNHPTTKEERFTVTKPVDPPIRRGSIVVKRGNRHYSVNPSLGMRLKSTKTYQTDTSLGQIYEVRAA